MRADHPGAPGGAAAGPEIRLGHASAQGPRARNEDFVGAATPALRLYR